MDRQMAAHRTTVLSYAQARGHAPFHECHIANTSSRRLWGCADRTSSVVDICQSGVFVVGSQTTSTCPEYAWLYQFRSRQTMVRHSCNWVGYLDLSSTPNVRVSPWSDTAHSSWHYHSVMHIACSSNYNLVTPTSPHIKLYLLLLLSISLSFNLWISLHRSLLSFKADPL